MTQLDLPIPAQRAALQQAAALLQRAGLDAASEQFVAGVLRDAERRLARPVAFEWRTPRELLVDGVPVPRRLFKAALAAFTALYARQVAPSVPVEFCWFFQGATARTGARNSLMALAKTYDQSHPSLAAAVRRIGSTTGGHLVVRGAKPVHGVECRMGFSFTLSRNIGVTTLLGGG